MEREIDIVRIVKTGKSRSKKGTYVQYLIRCLNCGKEYLRYSSQIKKGRGKFCSRKCFSSFEKSKETRERMSLAARNNPQKYWLGKKRSLETIEKVRKTQLGRLGHPHTEEMKKYLSQKATGRKLPRGSANSNWTSVIRYCANCGAEFFVQLNVIARGNGKYCSKRCYNEYAVGERNLNWKGGKTYSDYPSEFNDQLRKGIRERDNFTCQLCGMQEMESLIIFNNLLSVHHVDYNKKNCSQENLLTLCRACNTRVNHFRSHWTYQFRLALEERGIKTTVIKPKILQTEFSFN